MELEGILLGVDTATAEDHLHATKVQDEFDQPEKKLTYPIECPGSKHYTSSRCISDGHTSSSKEAGLTCQVHEDGFLSEMYDLTEAACYPSEMIPTFIKPLNYIRELLDPPLLSLDEYLTDEKFRLSSCYHLHAPVFLGRTFADSQVSHRIERQLSIVLSIAMRMDVTWENATDHTANRVSWRISWTSLENK